jgi:hypothetical protein
VFGNRPDYTSPFWTRPASLIFKFVHPRQFSCSEQSSRPSVLEQQFTCFEQPSRPRAFDHHVGTLSSHRTLDIRPDFPGLARNSLPTTVEPKTKPVAILAANQTAATSLPHDWLDFILPFSPQRTPSSTTQRNMESSEQTPATQGVPQSPSTVMAEATSSSPKEIIPLNALLIDTTPQAFLETVASDNAFATMNARAATLLGMPTLPEIPPSISRDLIKELRAGHRTMNTSIITELVITQRARTPRQRRMPAMI